MKGRTARENYLDLVPRIKKDLRWDIRENGNVVIYRENKGLTNRVARCLYGTPRETRIFLDNYGKFIWQLIDGRNSVYMIALMVKEQYGGKSEPLYERICLYFKALQENGFVVML